MAIDNYYMSGEEILTRLYDASIEVGLLNRRFEKGRIGLLYAVFAAEFENLFAIFDEYTKQFSLETVTDEALLESMLKQYLIRGTSNRARVVLRFTREADFNENITIPADFTVRDGSLDGAVFRTVEDLYMWKGTQSAIVVAYCDEIGSQFNVGADTLTVFDDTAYITKLSVTNPESAWGGKDEETLEHARERVVNFRYKREGTIAHIIDQIQEFSDLEYQQYKITEYTEGYGSVGITLLMDNDYAYEDLCIDLEQNKLAGIKYQFIRGVRKYIDLSVVITLGGNKDLTPTQDQEIYDKSDDIIRDFFGMGSGIGQDLSIDSLQASLNNQLSALQQNILKVEVSSASEDMVVNPVTRLIEIGDNEILSPNRVNTFINFVGA